MACCLIALGANLGNRAATLHEAVARLAAHPQITLLRVSPFYRSSPVGGPAAQPPFLNAAARLDTELAPEQLLEYLLQVEQQLGRVRQQPWGPRAIDLDLLLYEGQTRCTTRLQLPHPRMVFRHFVLKPAADVGGELVHPETGWTVARLLEHLESHPDYVALAGGTAAGRAELAENVAAELGIECLADPPRPPGSGGPAEEVAIEFLRARARKLGSVPFTRVAGWAAISDFWLGQSWAEAERERGEQPWSDFDACWREIASSRPAPKLLVILPPAVIDPMAAAVSRLHPGPRFWLPEDEAGWKKELAAAIEAMRSPVMAV